MSSGEAAVATLFVSLDASGFLLVGLTVASSWAEELLNHHCILTVSVFATDPLTYRCVDSSSLLTAYQCYLKYKKESEHCCVPQRKEIPMKKGRVAHRLIR